MSAGDPGEIYENTKREVGWANILPS
jgi:hypothetical protein